MNNCFMSFSPFRWFCLQTFPFIEDTFEGLNEYQILCKIVEYLNNTIKKTNEIGEQIEKLSVAFIDLKNYVDNYLENIDIQEDVSNKLNEMTLDGTLERIINQEIFSEINEKLNSLKGKLNSTRILRQLIARDFNIQSYSHLGGLCYIGDGNIVLCKSGSSNTSLGKIQVIRLSDGIVLRETTDTIYHCNSVCYNSKTGKLYVAPTSIDNNNKILIEFDYLTLNKTNEIDVTYLLGSIAYDNVNDVYYGKLDEGQGIKVCKYDNEFNIIELIELQMPSEFNGTQQAIEYYDNHIYFATSFPNIIFQFDLEGNLTNTYDLGNYMGEAFLIGELEDISIMNGDIYFGSISRNQNSNLRTISVGMTSLVRNITPFNLDFPENIELTQNWLHLIVDKSQNNINPTGTNTNAFNDIIEAVNFASSPIVHNLPCKIDIKNGNYDYAYINSPNICEIDGESAENTIVKGLAFINSNCYVNNLTIINKYQDGEYALPLTVNTNSNMKFHNVSVSNSQENIEQAINIDKSQISFSGAFEITNAGGLNDITLNANSGFICNANTSLRKVSSSINNNCEQELFSGSLITEEETKSYVNNITRDFIDSLQYKYINIQYYIADRPKIAKFIYSTTKTEIYAINDFNIVNEASSDNYDLCECGIQLTNDGVYIHHNKSIDKTGTLGNELITIQKIWLSNT